MKIFGKILIFVTFAFTFVDSEVLHPVILLPGLGASRLEARLNRTSTRHWFCRKESDWFTIWLNPEELIPSILNCFSDNFQRVYNPQTGFTRDADGVEIRVPGFGSTDTIEYLTPFRLGLAGYFANLVEKLVAEHGYERDLSIRGAPYDFRLSPYENEQYFIDFKHLVHDTYSMNGRKKVVLVCHSMGCLHSHYFLTRQTQDWKDKYLRAWITIGAPFGGAVKALNAVVGGEGLLHRFDFLKSELRSLERTFSSVPFLFPVDKVFGDRVILSYNDGTKTNNYTAKDMEQILNLVNYTSGIEMWKRSKDLITHYEHPGVDVHCIVGNASSSAESILYAKPDLFPLSPEFVFGNGDGTVNAVSANLCMKWANNNKHKPFSYQHFDNVKHINLVSNIDVVNYIVDEIAGMKVV